MTRYGIGQAVGVRSFPWATLSINVAGSALLRTDRPVAALLYVALSLVVGVVGAAVGYRVGRANF